jgi:hypothetical protein
MSFKKGYGSPAALEPTGVLLKGPVTISVHATYETLINSAKIIPILNCRKDLLNIIESIKRSNGPNKCK